MSDEVDRWLNLLLEPGTGILTEAELRKACALAKEILIEENNVPHVAAPCVVVGDIHGQYYDFLELIKLAGHPETTRYVFLGDYVDRGNYSVETISLLMVMKIRYPENVILIRGNHEARQVTQVYGFYDECVRKYGNANPWKYFMEVFDYLSLSVIIGDTVFGVHGGLSPFLPTVDQIRCLQRVQEVPTGPYGDLLWSDPEDNLADWEVNSRGAGWLFGNNPTKKFLHINGLSLIARAHQLVQEGYKFSFSDNECRYPGMLATIWSAPNYCYRCGNVASFMKIDNDCRASFEVFKEVQEPSLGSTAKHLVPYFL